MMSKIASLFYRLGAWFESFGKKPILAEPSAVNETVVVAAMPIPAQRDMSDYNRKMLMLLAKDELTEFEQKELEEMTAGKEVIILEDT